jgi:hypothetical protein
LTQKADTSPPSVIHVSGGGVINGLTINADQSGNVSSNVSKDTNFSWYKEKMTAHGVWYWVMHGVVALVVVALWEYRHWFVSLFSK